MPKLPPNLLTSKKSVPTPKNNVKDVVTLKKTPIQSSTIQVGDTVTVVTVYKVKRVEKGLVGVEDEFNDRVLNFRESELKLEKK